MVDIIRTYCDGVLIEEVGFRELPIEIEKKIELLKDSYKEKILLKYPEHKQRNAALGILSKEEVSEIQLGIKELIQDYKTKENLLKQALCIEDLEAVLIG